MAVRSVKAFLDLGGSLAPTPAERAVIRAVQAGEACELGDAVPTAATPENTVRAALLRLLITGGTPDCGTQDFGVWVEGAWITGKLHLGFAKARGQTVLNACRFAAAPDFTEARLNLLSLDGSHLPGLPAQGLRLNADLVLRGVTATGTVDVAGAKVGGQMDCDGATFDGPIVDGKRGEALNAQGVETGHDLFFRGVTATGTVDVAGAKVGGQMDCDGATFDGAGGMALNAQGVETGQDLFLSGVRATGTVYVAGAKVGGHMDCEGATFDGAGGKALNAQGVETGQSLFLSGVRASGTVAVNAAKVGGQMDCSDATFDGAGGMALHAQRLHVVQDLFWRDVTVRGGVVVLGAAQVGDLADDGRWPGGVDALVLDGFTYDRIVGDTAPLTAAGRRGWLRAGSVWEGRFLPQPFTQLARVFRAMGHGGEARTVLFWREQAVFAQARRDLLAAPVGHDDMLFGHLGREVRAAGLLLGDWVLRVVAGYGYRPLRALGCLIVLWVLAAVLAWQVWEEGSFAPNSDVVLVSEGWQRAERADCIPRVPEATHTVCDPNPAQTWSNDPARGMDWDSFQPLGYALDLVVPVLNLGQTDAWAPSKDRGWWGWGLWWGRWVLIALGWIVTAVGAAAVTGIMQKDRE